VLLRNVGNFVSNYKAKFFRSKFWVECGNGDGKFRHAGATCSDARPSDFIYLNTDRTTPVGDAWENALNPATASKLFAPRWALVGLCESSGYPSAIDMSRIFPCRPNACNYVVNDHETTAIPPTIHMMGHDAGHFGLSVE
jgi:hypothetical protein